MSSLHDYHARFNTVQINPPRSLAAACVVLCILHALAGTEDIDPKIIYETAQCLHAESPQVLDKLRESV